MLTQTVRLNIDLQGRRADVIQFQVFLTMHDRGDSRRRAVLYVVLSSLPGRFRAVLGDFEQFLSTIRPESRAD